TEISFGAGCAEVEDDRVIVHPPEDPVLWTIDVGIAPFVRASRGARDFTVRPMPPDGRYLLATLDSSGQVTTSQVTITPAPPPAHVVLNEVMANPAGAEPGQEWVELYNDGST